MHYLIEQSILPIINGMDAVGQGFFADGYFITAMHVVKDFPHCYIKLDGKVIKLINEEPLLQGERDIWHDETQHDVIMYPFKDTVSPLHLSARRVTFEDSLKSYCVFPKYDYSTGAYNNELSVEEALLKNQGTANYLWCQCDRHVGSSGSPLLIDNQVVGIMHGGNDRGLCAFLKVQSFLLPPEPKKYNLFNKPEEPWTAKYFNDKAQSQIGDAFE